VTRSNICWWRQETSPKRRKRTRIFIQLELHFIQSGPLQILHQNKILWISLNSYNTRI